VEIIGRIAAAVIDSVGGRVSYLKGQPTCGSRHAQTVPQVSLGTVCGGDIFSGRRAVASSGCRAGRHTS